LKELGQFGPKFQLQGVVPLFVRKLGWSIYDMV